MTSVHSNASFCPSATTVTIQYLFPRCLPCLSRKWTHNQTSSAPRTSLHISESMHFWTHVYFGFFCFVLVGTTTSQNIRHFFLTSCVSYNATKCAAVFLIYTVFPTLLAVLYLFLIFCLVSAFFSEEKRLIKWTSMCECT